MQIGAQERIVIMRLFLALISGGVIGFERSAKGIDAGFRTHILVCVSSCAIMLTNLHMYLTHQTGDPMRMPAQVISGVGFLGAGCILVIRQQRIKGVTTAAGLWSAACLGLCIGAGDYVVAGFVLIAAIFSLTALRVVDRHLTRRTRYLRFYAELESVSAMTQFLKYLRKHGMKVTEVEFVESKISNSLAAVISLHLQKPDCAERLISGFEQIDGVLYTTDL